ncbi:nuclear transport factor 2 family protein [Paraburkholderia sediminicola]|uniref:nuclear transport factor 2 family protein n=1 Tax=Paraburkholderia sediminicola TaxID=458836 RepID=UPI0038B9FF8F
MEQKIRDMLAAIDRQDLGAFGAFLSDDARFTFGNGDAIYGREPIVSVVQGVLQSLRSISHTAQRFWQVDDVAICEGRVRYVDSLGQTLDAPFIDVLSIDANECITDYRVYVDASQLNQSR